MTMTRLSRTHLAAPAIAGAKKQGVLKSLTVARRRACEAVALGMGISCAASEGVGAGPASRVEAPWEELM